MKYKFLALTSHKYIWSQCTCRFANLCNVLTREIKKELVKLLSYFFGHKNNTLKHINSFPCLYS